MHAFQLQLGGLTGSLLKVSAQASLLIAVVLLVQWLGGRKLSPRVRYALWLLVVARLLLPVSLESGFSVFNFTTATPAEVFRAVAAASKTSVASTEAKNAPAPNAPAASAPAPSGAASSSAASASLRATPVQSPTSLPQVSSTARAGAVNSFPWAATLSLGWLAGVVFLLARIIWIPLRLNARLARHETATSPAVFDILEESKRLSGVNQVLPIVQSRAVESPALLGFIRPWLLLPDGLVEKFTPQELRLVFLHELAHLKRRDIAVNWLATLVQILHWPNPLVWLAFARMRADRELACDELALSFARAEENQTYGHAIIKLLEGFARPAALPGLVGILEDQTQMKKRIIMIAQFKKMTQWSAAAAGLVLVLGLVTLTDAQSEKTPAAARIFGGDGPTAKILISGSGYDASGILSPDESMVGYVEWAGKGGDAVIRDLNSGKTRNLTASSRGPNYEYADGGCWSPDSRAVAFSWFIEGAGNSVRMISLESGASKVLLEMKEQESFSPEDWSPDGKLLVGTFRKKDGPRSLATLEVATGEMHVLGTFQPTAQQKRFSPDGRFIVFDRRDDGNRDIFVVSVDGGEPVRLAASSADDGSPVFSADGKHVLFSSNRRGSWDLWAVGFENGREIGAPVLVKYDFGDYQKWMTKSGKLAFSIQAVQAGAFEVSVPATGSAPTPEPREISKSYLGAHGAPAWSRDGQKVAYVRLSTPPLLCVQSLADGHEETFNTGMGQIQFAFWAPDGETVALRGVSKNGPGVYLFSLATRKSVSTPLGTKGKVYAQGKAYPLGFSNDGEEFGFMVWDGNHRERVSLDLKTGVERTVTTAGDRAWIEAERDQSFPPLNYHVSQDGARVVGVETVGKEDRIVVADSANRNRRIVARAPDPAELGAPRWSPDGTKLAYYFWASGDAARKQLHVCAADGSWDRVVNTGQLYIKSGAMAPSWSVDSTKLAVTLNGDIPNQIGVLENLFPKNSLAAK